MAVEKKPITPIIIQMNITMPEAFQSPEVEPLATEAMASSKRVPSTGDRQAGSGDEMRCACNAKAGTGGGLL